MRKKIAITKRCKDADEITKTVDFLKLLLPNTAISYSVERVYIGEARDSRTAPIHLSFWVDNNDDLNAIKEFCADNEWQIKVY